MKQVNKTDSLLEANLNLKIMQLQLNIPQHKRHKLILI